MKRLLTVLTGIAAVPVLLGLGGYVWVGRALEPGGPPPGEYDFKALRLPVETVRFSAEDGTPLEGWYVPGDPGAPGILLAHDFGANRSFMLNLIVPLHARGYHCLAWDARGHGTSRGRRSTLGVRETGEVTAAADVLRAQLGEEARLGVYGVGMGAHAAVLAAAEREEIRVLVLDGLYPDPAWRLRRELPSLPFAARWLELAGGVSIASNRAEDRVSTLFGKDVLFVAPAGDSRLAEEIARMHRTFPARRDTESSMVTLSATQSRTLYGGELDRYQQKIVSFFLERLP